MNSYEVAKATIDTMIKKYNLKVSKKEYIDLLEESIYAYCSKFGYCYIRQNSYIEPKQTTQQVADAVNEIKTTTSSSSHTIGDSLKSIFKRVSSISIK